MATKRSPSDGNWMRRTRSRVDAYLPWKDIEALRTVERPESGPQAKPASAASAARSVMPLTLSGGCQLYQMPRRR